ncbi:NucA/NucB deoxyribonuclease domain-containing protein [Uniformispora flossi]|uniref:NucA/NucB deoxyribonuclease domain-containing protein n=1 Tax=Uniformispora flossi TaxID=3390723 RepID=UPI003C30663A
MIRKKAIGCLAATLTMISGAVMAAPSAQAQPQKWSQTITTYDEVVPPPVGSTIDRATLLQSFGLSSKVRPQSATTEDEISVKRKQLGEFVIVDPAEQEPPPVASTLDDDLEKCKTAPGAADDGGEYGNTWNWCHRINGISVWGVGNQVKGTLTWTQVTTARVQGGSRDFGVKFTAYNFKPSGDFNVNSRLETGLVLDNGTGGECQIQDSQNPAVLTVSEWSNPSGYATWNVKCPETGDFIELRNMTGVNIATITPDAPNAEWAWGAANTVRQDSAPYFSQKLASSFPLVYKVFPHRVTGTDYNAVSQHIKEFYDAYPSAPGNFNTLVSDEASAFPLERNYAAWNDEAGQVERGNTNAKNRECALLPPHQPGEECDEFPFNSTREGGNSGGDFSVKYIPGGENSKGGFYLADCYLKARTLHLDPFYVWAY